MSSTKECKISATAQKAACSFHAHAAYWLCMVSAHRVCVLWNSSIVVSKDYTCYTLQLHFHTHSHYYHFELSTCNNQKNSLSNNPLYFVLQVMMNSLKNQSSKLISKERCIILYLTLCVLKGCTFKSAAHFIIDIMENVLDSMSEKRTQRWIFDNYCDRPNTFFSYSIVIS